MEEKIQKKGAGEEIIKIAIISALLVVAGFALTNLPPSFNLLNFNFDLRIIKIGFILSIIGFIFSLIIIGIKYTSKRNKFRKALEIVFHNSFKWTLYVLAALIIANLYIWITLYFSDIISNLKLMDLQSSIFIFLIGITFIIFYIINEVIKGKNGDNKK